MMDKSTVYTTETKLVLVKLDYYTFSFDLNANFKIKSIGSEELGLSHTTLALPRARPSGLSGSSSRGHLPWRRSPAHLSEDVLPRFAENS